ncbi:type A2 lanthipeptide [Paenibacillus sp. PsM32]|nr:type A2 lanthipeptide [Paenibacillus sp. PsM32]MDN4617835.1 type A2 lanthipeptide [Paenibacillus sp. PsM32]
MKELFVDLSAVEDITEAELQAAVAPGDGWLATLTDDCPNSIIVCC